MGLSDILTGILSDILTGMMNGPRGERQPSSGGSGGGMSPIMMALL